MTKKTRAELLEENSYLLEENSSLKQRLNLITSTYNQHVKLCSSASRTTPPPDLCHDENAPALNKPLAGGRGSTNSTIPAQHTIPVDHRDIHIQHTVLTNEASPKPSTLSNEASIPHTTPTDPNDQVPTTKKRKQWEIEAGTLAEKFKKPRHEPSSLEPRPSYDATITEIILGISWDIQGLSMDPNLDPISSMEKYAWITKNSRGRAKHTSSVASFQDLIFHSACAVLEHCGVSAESIDMVMRITTSESQPKNLKRLRSGAVWVNEVISKLTEGEWTGLSDCIAELLFHSE
jgi:hypothetical protein